MMDHGLWRRPARGIQNFFPLFRYLLLQTETHAFCLGLAAASLLAFFPGCLVILAVFKDILKWKGASEVLLVYVVQTYFPIDQDFVISNLRARLAMMGQRTGIASLLWVLLGAAGVFVPLETALNRLWNVEKDRPYWLNQIVGFTLTICCTLLALLFVSIATALHGGVARMGPLPFNIVRSALHFTVTRVTMTCFFMVTIFAFYKFLPNTRIPGRQVLPAAILAGILAELVRVIFVRFVPDLAPTQGPFYVSVTFLLLVYFETFVVLGCAFLASRTERYPWIGFFRRKADQSSS
jgi:membrane protein/epoxyqueuosine reductase